MHPAAQEPDGADRVRPDDKKRSQDAGFDLHMVKPVDPAALERLLAGLKATTG